MLKNTFLASAVAVATMAAPVFATTLNGTFTINIRNFTDSDPGPDVTNASSAATAVNVAAVAIDATITYTGDLDFNAGSSTNVWDFLTSGGGAIVFTLGDQALLQSTVLSQGDYVTTTFFEIFGNFATDVLSGTINHDDGITLIAANGQTGGVSAPPTSLIPTAFTAEAGDFRLLYAAANGNPSILNVDATLAPVPLPAGGLLLIGALGGLAALRRRKTA